MSVRVILPFLCFLRHSLLDPLARLPLMRPFSRPPALRRRMRLFIPHTLPARAVPSLRCFAPHPDSPPSTRPAATPRPPADARSPCVLAPACYIVPPPKNVFLRVFRPYFCRKFLFNLSCRPLYKTYFYKYILLYNNYCMQENMHALEGGFSRGGGVFSREPFFKSARAPKRLLWGFQRAGIGRNDRRGGEDGGRGRRAGAETGRKQILSVGRGPPSE